MVNFEKGFFYQNDGVYGGIPWIKPLQVRPETEVAQKPVSLGLVFKSDIAMLFYHEAFTEGAYPSEIKPLLWGAWVGGQMVVAENYTGPMREGISTVIRVKKVPDEIIRPNHLLYCLSTLHTVSLATPLLTDRIVADLGCGAGPMGISALLNGARRGHFVDNNFGLIDETKENLEVNNVLDRGVLYGEDIGELEQGHFPIENIQVVIANIGPHDFYENGNRNQSLSYLLGVLEKMPSLETVIMGGFGRHDDRGLSPDPTIRSLFEMGFDLSTLVETTIPLTDKSGGRQINYEYNSFILRKIPA